MKIGQRSVMAVTKFWSLAFLVLLTCILEQKSCSWLEHTVINHKGIPGGDIELNPGDKHLCSICSKPARPHQATNQRVVCNPWFHARCCKLPSIYIDILSRSFCTWLCPKCGRQNSKPYSSDSEVLPSSLNYFEPLFNSRILPSNSNKPEPSKDVPKDVPKNNRRKVICMTMNCRSAKNKIADIAAVIDQHKPDIIFSTEAWLNSNIEGN